MEDIISLDKQYIAGTYGRFPVELVSGKGSLLTAADGKTYIDMGSGIAVSAFGTADDVWAAAVTQQLTKLQHTSNLYYTSPCVQLAKLLCEKTGMKKVFFSNSGAEANECAIKVARKYSAEKKGGDCYTIVTLCNSFHGRTLTTLAATGQDHYHELFQPLTPGFVHVHANDIEELKRVVSQVKVAGILMECVQGEGGVLPVSKAYMEAAAEICREQDIPLMIDEVQTGNGRCGALYAYMNYGVQPDIVSTAKGLGGGLPIGATLLSKKVQDVLRPGDHGSTFGGNPVCCAGALSVISRLDDRFLEQVRDKSQYIFEQLQGASGIQEVTGMGLMIGIKTDRDAKDVLAACRDKGVLCLTAKDKIRLLPPLNIPMELLEQAVAVIRDACAV
ncbi:MAG: aspartate aminotransferase family protein [Oscillospiraceae bacterium]|nr:aspartate aminotransferase family protein [Oscillospiraceae bacterium]